MKRPCSSAVMVLLAALAQVRAPAAELDAPTQIRTALFGNVTVYKPTHAEATSVALFVSGDGGWNLGVVDTARSLAGTGAAVVGIDKEWTRKWRANRQRAPFRRRLRRYS